MTSTMGRRRQSNLDLPPRMHLKSGTYYYVTTDKPRKWISLGKDLNDARRKWADIEEAFSRDDADREAGRAFKALGHDCDRKQWERVRALWMAKEH